LEEKMGIKYFNDKVQVSHSLSKKETEEINLHFKENPEKIFRLYWFENDNNDFNFLKSMDHVKKLEINYSKLNDLKFLENIKNIEYLDINEINGNPDITPIENLIHLKVLNINLRKSTKQNDLKCLNNLKELEELNFNGKFKKNSLGADFGKLNVFGPQLNCIDILEIHCLKNIKILKIFNQKINTLNGLEKITGLNILMIHQVKIDTQKILTPIFSIKLLEKLSLAYIKTIEDFSFTTDNETIRKLYLWSLNGLKSLKGIDKLKSLEYYSQCGEHSNKNTIDFSEIKKIKQLKDVEIKVGAMNEKAKMKLNELLEYYKNKSDSA
jgi:hypothetical protein